MRVFFAVLFTFLTNDILVAQSTPVKNDSSTRIEINKLQRIRLGDLKGSRAKNYPTHKYNSSIVMVEVLSNVAERPKGPEAKNYKPWRHDTRTQQMVMKKKKRENLKGPRAKNRKPWKNGSY